MMDVSSERAPTLTPTPTPTLTLTLTLTKVAIEALVRHREQARRIHATRVAERVQLQMMSSQHLPG